ncbi:MAG: gamma-glutamyltransferase [Thermoanaerobaculales bacterium]|nr:gamma-glutamyltransferase [Thermoanaerobaculales bacterium]
MSRHGLRIAAAACALAALAGCTARGGRPAAPLYAVAARSDHGMVASGSEEATRAGVAVLEQGGNAVDAAVAAAFALGVADPGGSGLGGLTYMLIAPADGIPVAIDGSTPAPLAADPAALRAIRDSGAYYGHAAASVPTTPATLAHALARYGTLPLSAVLEPAIEIAEQGYRLSSSNIAWTTSYLDEIRASQSLRFIVLADGASPGRPGDRLCRPELRQTLLRLAREGVETFYGGSMAAEIAADMARNGGFVRQVDLATYRPRELQPLRSSYRGAEVVTFPSPGGGPEVVAALNILQTFPTTVLGEPSLQRLQLLIESARLAHADHARHILGSGAAAGFGVDYLSERHARERAALITPGRALPESEVQEAAGTSMLGEHTTHLSVIDAEGTVVSLTQTLCNQFGAKVVTPGLGFPYNCCLEFLDFENAASPFHLRPRGIYPTGMAPTIVRSADRVTVLGGAGSDRIPPSLVAVISNLIDRGMELREAVVEPRVLWNSASNPPRVCIEIAEPISRRDADTLRSFGFEHQFRLAYPPEGDANIGFFGGVNAVAYDGRSGVFSGVADPRREGFALGPRALAEAADGP